MRLRNIDYLLAFVLSVAVAHFIVTFGLDEKLSELLLMRGYYLAMAGSTIIAFAIIAIIHAVSAKLDKRWDWREQPFKRTVFQAVFGIGCTSVAAFLLAAVYFWARGYNILDTLYLRIDFPVIVLMIIFLNTAYLVVYLLRKADHYEKEIKSRPMTASENPDGTKRTFIVSYGTKNIPVNLEDIAYFFRSDATILRTFSGEDYIIPNSLDEVQQLLPESDFFRTNRAFLVNIRACLHYEMLPFNKLQLFTKPNYKSPIVISQKRNRNFRDWVEG